MIRGLQQLLYLDFEMSETQMRQFYRRPRQEGFTYASLNDFARSKSKQAGQTARLLHFEIVIPD